MSNKINFCEYSGDDCTWCKKRIFDHDKNIIKIHSHNEVDNSLKKDENGNIKISEMFHKKCMEKKNKLEKKVKKYNEKINKFISNNNTSFNQCIKCHYNYKQQFKSTLN